MSTHGFFLTFSLPSLFPILTRGSELHGPSCCWELNHGTARETQSQLLALAYVFGVAWHDIEFQRWVDGRRREPDFTNMVQSLTAMVVTKRPWKKDDLRWASVATTAATRAGAGSLTTTKGDSQP